MTKCFDLINDIIIFTVYKIQCNFNVLEMKLFLRKLNIFIIILLFQFNLLSQNPIDKFIIEGNSYPLISISNMVKWHEMPLSKWDEEIKQYDFRYKSTESLSIAYFSKKKDMNLPCLEIYKYIDKHVLVIWKFEQNSSYGPILNEIYNKLEPGYFESKFHGAHFKYIKNNKTYEINIIREGGLEMISIRYYMGVKEHK
jgi:hypothetical protein